MTLYQDQILDHYHCPRCQGSLEAPTYTAESSNLSCGDQLHMDISVRDGILETMRWSGSGCAISQASASILLESLEGKSVDEARTMTAEQHLERLGIPLSVARVKCALLSLETLHKALRG